MAAAVVEPPPLENLAFACTQPSLAWTTTPSVAAEAVWCGDYCLDGGGGGDAAAVANVYTSTMPLDYVSYAPFAPPPFYSDAPLIGKLEDSAPFAIMPADAHGGSGISDASSASSSSTACDGCGSLRELAAAAAVVTHSIASALADCSRLAWIAASHADELANGGSDPSPPFFYPTVATLAEPHATAAYAPFFSASSETIENGGGGYPPAAVNRCATTDDSATPINGYMLAAAPFEQPTAFDGVGGGYGAAAQWL